MKKVSKKEENKKSKKNLIIVILICLATVLALSLSVCLYNKYTSDAYKFKKEYESLNATTREKDGKTIRSITISSNNPMVYSNEDEIIDKINNKETFVVYFGFEDCPWCRSMLPSLIEVAKEEKLDKIYYVNVKEIRDELSFNSDGNIVTSKKGTKGYYKLLKVLDDVLADYNLMTADGQRIATGEKRIYAPNIVAIENGKATRMTEGLSEKQTDGYAKLTNGMKKDMKDQIRCIIKCVTGKNKACSPKTGC